MLWCISCYVISCTHNPESCCVPSWQHNICLYKKTCVTNPHHSFLLSVCERTGCWKVSHSHSHCALLWYCALLHWPNTIKFICWALVYVNVLMHSAAAWDHLSSGLCNLGWGHNWMQPVWRQWIQQSSLNQQGDRRALDTKAFRGDSTNVWFAPTPASWQSSWLSFCPFILHFFKSPSHTARNGIPHKSLTIVMQAHTCSLITFSNLCCNRSSTGSESLHKQSSSNLAQRCAIFADYFGFLVTFILLVIWMVHIDHYRPQSGAGGATLEANTT